MHQNSNYFKDWKVFASVLSANPLCLEQELCTMSPLVDGFHWDIMDGHYVPNLTLGPHVIQKARSILPEVWFDVHIMANPSDDIISLFETLPIQSLAFHPETVKNPLTVIEALHRKGIYAGVAVNLTENLHAWPTLLWNHIDYILIMAVKPGFSGQKFHPHALNQIRTVQRYTTDAGIWVDGGIIPETAHQCRTFGASGVISGKFLFEHQVFSEKRTLLRSELR